MKNSRKIERLGLLAIGTIISILTFFTNFTTFHRTLFLISLYFCVSSFSSILFLAAHQLANSSWKTELSKFNKHFESLTYLFSYFLVISVIQLSLQNSSSISPTSIFTGLALILFSLLHFRILHKVNSTVWSAIYCLVYPTVMIFSKHFFSGLFHIELHNTLISWFFLICGVVNSIAVFAILNLSKSDNKIITDVSRFLFAFCCIWMYFWYSQFMLTWYGNLPHEIESYYVQFKKFPLLFYLNIILNFGLPFILLLTKIQKKNKFFLFVSSCSVIIGQWININLLFLSGSLVISLSVIFILVSLIVLYLKLLIGKSSTVFLAKCMLIALFLCGNSCKTDRNHPGFVYFPEMDKSSSVQSNQFHPYFKDSTSMRPPVRGTVPREFIPYQLRKNSRDVVKAKTQVCPIEASEENVVEGKELYEEYCSQCHGINADGKGPLFTKGYYGYKPADLTSEKIQSKTEGELFHSISVGYNLMKAHKPILTPEERWKIVLFIKNSN